MAKIEILPLGNIDGNSPGMSGSSGQVNFGLAPSVLPPRGVPISRQTAP